VADGLYYLEEIHSMQRKKTNRVNQLIPLKNMRITRLLRHWLAKTEEILHFVQDDIILEKVATFCFLCYYRISVEMRAELRGTYAD